MFQYVSRMLALKIVELVNLRETKLMFCIKSILCECFNTVIDLFPDHTKISLLFLSCSRSKWPERGQVLCMGN